MAKEPEPLQSGKEPTIQTDIPKTDPEVIAAILTESAKAAGASTVNATLIGAALAYPDKPSDYED